MADALPDAPWATGGDKLPDAPWAAPDSAGGQLVKSVTDVPHEMYESTAEAASGARQSLPKTLGGDRDTLSEGPLERIGKTGAGVMSAVSTPFAPLQGVYRSLIGHPLAAADQAMRDLAVKMYGEDKVRMAERAAGVSEGGMTYEQAKAKADLASSALMPGRGGLHSAPVPMPSPPPTGPLGVTLSEGQLTRELPAIRNEQAALRGQLGPDAERAAKAFSEQQIPEVQGAREQVSRGLDPFNAQVAETPQEAGTLVSDAMQREATSRKAGVKQAYDYANALPGEIHASAFKTIAPDIKLDLSSRPDPIVIDDKLTPFASQAIKDIEGRIGNLNIQNRANPFGQPPQQSIQGVTLKGVDQMRRRLSTFRNDAYSSGNAADGRAARAVVDAFDDHIEDAIKGGFFNGDPRAVNAWLDARAAHADFKRTFGAGKNDPVGRVVEKIIGKGNSPAAIPNDVADFMYGSSGVNPNSLNVGVAKRVMGILGDQSPEWSAVKQGLFSRVVEPPPGVTDWGPTKIAQRLNKFMNGDGKEMADIMFSPAERKLIEQYSDLQRHLEVPPTGANRSETSTFMVRHLRKIGGTIGMAVGAAIGHIALPGMPWGVSEGLGAGTAKVAGKVADKLQARQISKQMPLVTTRLKQYQKAVAAANRANSPLSNTTVGIASANLMRSLEGMGIRVPALQGAIPAGAGQENQQP